LAGFLVWSVGLAWSHGKVGRGYEAAGFAQSEVMGAVEKIPANVRVYSNDPTAVAYVTGRQPVRLALAPGDVNSIGRRPTALGKLGQLACSHRVQLAWLGHEPVVPASLGDADELRDGVLVAVACNR
jgi:hypothetical protein